MKSCALCMGALVALLLVVSPNPAGAGTVFVTTGQSGAQVQVDVNHTQYWTLTPTAEVHDIVGGLFVMKVGPHTSEPITLTIFEGNFADPGREPVLTATLQPSAFTQSFAPVHFTAPAITLSKGIPYTAVLASPAKDAQAHAYFIKSAASLYFSDDSGNPIDPTGPTPPAVPTPAAATGGLLLLAGLAIKRFCRRA